MYHSTVFITYTFIHTCTKRKVKARDDPREIMKIEMEYLEKDEERRAKNRVE